MTSDYFLSTRNSGIDRTWNRHFEGSCAAFFTRPTEFRAIPHMHVGIVDTEHIICPSTCTYIAYNYVYIHIDAYVYTCIHMLYIYLDACTWRHVVICMYIRSLTHTYRQQDAYTSTHLPTHEDRRISKLLAFLHFLLSPVWNVLSRYTWCIFLDTHDVSKHLFQGDNLLASQLAPPFGAAFQAAGRIPSRLSFATITSPESWYEDSTRPVVLFLFF